MFPLRWRTTVVGERGHRLARGHVRVVVLRAVPGTAIGRHLAVPARPRRAVLVTCPAVPGAAVAAGIVARAVVAGPGVVTAAVSRAVVARIAVAGTVIASLVVAGTVIASLVVASRRARLVAAVGVPARLGAGTLVAALLVACLLVATLLVARRITATALVAGVVVPCVARFGVRRARAVVSLVAVPALGITLLAVLAAVPPGRLEGLALATALVVPVALVSRLGVRLPLVGLLLVGLLLVSAVVVTLAGVGPVVIVLAGVGRPRGVKPGGRRLPVRGRGIRPVAAIGPGARLLAIPVSLVTRLGGSRVPAVLVPLARLRRLGCVGSLGSVSILVAL